MANLSQALKQLHKERQRVQSELSRLDGAIHALQGYGTKNGSGRARRTLSVAARKRIAAAQRARWAKWKATRKKAA